MKKILLSLTAFLCLSATRGQQALTLYNMDMISQSAHVNPSMFPANRMYIGIPLLSSNTILFMNTGFTWRDLHKVRKDDSVSLDIQNAISKLAAKNLISFSFRNNIVETGFRIKNTYFNLNVTENVNVNFTFPKELAELIVNGNGPFVGRSVDLTSMNFDATHYREYAVGVTRQLGKKITGGARVKYLYGMENFSSGKNSFSFYTAPDDYRLELSSEYTVHTSASANGGNSGNYMFGLKNTGLGADLGITYMMNQDWKVSASVIDMGYIRWKSNVKNYVTAPGTYTFEGVDIAEFMSDSSSGMDNVGDSISDAFSPVENGDAYTTKIPTHYYMNVSYRIDEKMHAAGLFHAMSFRGSVQPSFTASLNRRLTDHFTASITYSIINRHFDNVGAGIVMHAGAFQFYVLSDNWIGTINPLSNHTTHLNFGFNLVYGRPKKKAPAKIQNVTAIPSEFVK